MSGLSEFAGLVGLAGGPGRVLLVGQGPPGTKAGLQAFARELFAPDEEREAAKAEPEGKEEPRVRNGAPGRARASQPLPLPLLPLLLRRREVGVRLGGCRGPLPGGVPPGLVVVLVAAPSLLEPRGRRLLREMLLDLRLRLDPPRRPSALALVGVAVLLQEPREEEEQQEGQEEEEEARRQLEGLLRRTLGPGRPPQALQAALHRPGAGAREVRAAACSALRAALRRSQAAADEEEPKKQKLPLFLKCLPWGRRRQQRKGHLGTDTSKFNEDTPQDQDEGLALT